VSKYRIEIAPSKQKFIVQILFWGLILLTPFYWKPDIFPYQGFIKLVIFAVVLWGALKSWIQFTKSTMMIVDLSEQGQWEHLNPEHQFQWLISARSRVSPWLLWVHLVSPLNLQKARWVIIFKDQVSEHSYRRICGAILLRQHLGK
jgi:hypothetical protein